MYITINSTNECRMLRIGLKTVFCVLRSKCCDILHWCLLSMYNQSKILQILICSVCNFGWRYWATACVQENKYSNEEWRGKNKCRRWVGAIVGTVCSCSRSPGWTTRPTCWCTASCSSSSPPSSPVSYWASTTGLKIVSGQLGIGTSVLFLSANFKTIC